MREKLKNLLATAEGADTGSVLALMGASGSSVGQDIPAAAEMLALLRHFEASLPFFEAPGSEALQMMPGIYARDDNHLVALVPVGTGELDLIAYWISQSLQSPEISALPGLLALPFSIEEHDEQEWLIPEWFALFYVDSSEEHCVPVLTLRSILDDERFGDWVGVALARAEAFGLPKTAAAHAVSRVVPVKASAA
ncbi:hypothetical protein [Castellaniella sp.]|uniref:hypothetical protein n=1 Tax=Castellaniella sp. TaxID=1955812 RepID=UPI002B00120E|nr:hypothetical protein [Castellaniella sp.]